MPLSAFRGCLPESSLLRPRSKHDSWMIARHSRISRSEKTRRRPSGGEIRKRQRWTSLYLLFPREGTWEVDLRDKSIEFVTKISDQKISRKFKLKAMVLDGVPAF